MIPRWRARCALALAAATQPSGPAQTQAFVCTDQQASALQILNWFVKRWQIEVTFEQERARLGEQTQRQWSDRALARSTPFILGLYSVVTLLASHTITIR